MKLRDILTIQEDDGGAAGAAAGATTSADIATVAYPLFVRGKTRKEKRKNARKAVGQSNTAGPAGVGTGVYENTQGVAEGQEYEQYKVEMIDRNGKMQGIYHKDNTHYNLKNMLSDINGYQRSNPQHTFKLYINGKPVDWKELAANQGVAEATGDPKFDKMLKGITAKKAVAKQQKADAKQQAQAAFGGMFGGGNPADQLGAKKKDVEEAHALDNNSVIYRLDKERPMSDTEVLMLGGAGRYTLNGLRNKARKEARALATDLEVEHGGSFRDAAENIKQLTNTLNTIVAAYNELRRIRQKGGRGSRGITDEHATFVRECLTMLENYTTIVNRASRIVESIQFKLTETMKQGKMNSDQASTIKGMFHLNTDPGYGFYRWAIHVAGNHGGDKVVLGPNGGPFAYAYTAEEEKMIRDAVRAITGKDAIELTGGKSEEPDFVNTKSTMPTIDWKKVK